MAAKKKANSSVSKANSSKNQSKSASKKSSAKEKLNKVKMEAASEVGVTLKNGYNGNLTSRQAGSVGGQMVNNVCPVRTVKFIRNNRNSDGHEQEITYNIALAFC